MNKYMGSYRIRLADTDAAGLLFFSRIYDYAHACYEDFMQQNQLELCDILKQGEFLLPIISSSAEYKQPLSLGQQINISLLVENISTSSFTLAYQFLNQENQLLASVKTVHVSIAMQSKAKIALPENLLKVLCLNG